MSNLPTIKAKDFINVIEELGFYFDRQKCSHAIYKKMMGKGLLFQFIQERILSNVR